MAKYFNVFIHWALSRTSLIQQLLIEFTYYMEVALSPHIMIFVLQLAMSTRTTRTPAFWGYPPPPHDYPSHWVILDPKSKEGKVKVTNLKNSPKFEFFKFWNGHYTRHTFWSCLIRCANMKWIRWVLLKIDTERTRFCPQTDRRTRWYQYTPLSTSLKRGV